MRTGHYSLQTKVRLFIDPKAARLEIALLAAAALAEVWLARREAPWPGLIPPGLALLRGLAKIVALYGNGGSAGFTLAAVLLEFALSNVSTLVLLVIYAVCRESSRRKRRRDREKMRLDDLHDL